MMVPNIILSFTHKEAFLNVQGNKTLEVFEQIGRLGCFFFMVINIPYTWFDFYIPFGYSIYLGVNYALLGAYLFTWIILWKKDTLVRQILLSVLPSLIFLFSSIMIASIPLFLTAIIFSISHVMLSIKNVLPKERKEHRKRRVLLTSIGIVLYMGLIGFTALLILGNYSKSSLAKLEKMTPEEMIQYDCYKKDVKISYALIKDGKTSFFIYGDKGLEEEKTLYDYEIGSLSKTYLGLFFAKMISEGKCSLDDSIAKYLELPKKEYYPTIRRLLTHTSGYQGYYFEPEMVYNKYAQISNDFYGISKTKILTKIGQVNLKNQDYSFQYSNFGIAVLGLVIEAIYEDSFTNVMNDFIVNELGLNSTGAAKQKGNLKGYWKWKEEDGYLPAGSIISNINDMAFYLSTLMNDSLSYVNFSLESLKEIEMHNSFYESLGIHMDSIGMTWIHDDYDHFTWHNGATTAFNSYLAFNDEKTLGIVLLANLNSNDHIPLTVIGNRLLKEQA